MPHCKQDQAEFIAAALHAVEAHIAKPIKKDKKLGVLVSRLHRLLHEAACEHGAELGIDVTPLSGGLPKPD